jgi:hypothetical protein
LTRRAMRLAKKRSAFSAGPLETPEQRAYHARVTREHEAFTRLKNNLFGYWRSCRSKRCRRMRACAGEPHECFRVNWAKTPEDAKHWYRTAAMARAKGHSYEEAARMADEAVRQFVEEQEAKARTVATLTSAEVGADVSHRPVAAPQVANAQSGPRLRCP